MEDIKSIKFRGKSAGGEIVDGATVSISSFSEAPVLDIVSYFKELEGK